MNKELLCGLFADDQEVPLEGIRIAACLTDSASEVTITQRYRNRETVPVEAVYVFPLPEEAAVCGFAALLDERTLTGHVEERDKAFETYDDAMAEGHGAFLLDQERPNVFTASVGNLRPGESVEIEIRYVALASTEGEAIRLLIPTTVSPRYVPRDQPPEVGQPDGERVNPPRWLTVPYGLTLEVEVEMPGGLRAVESPSHPVRTTMGEKGAKVELSQAEAALDRDFVLLVETAEPHRPGARMAQDDDGTPVCCLSFLPDPEAEDRRSEVLFLLDCSGSMQGDSIDQARRALALCIRALSAGDTFNIVRFGSRHEALWHTPKPFNQRTLEAATRYVERADADLNGTEMLAPLESLLQPAPDPERRRQVLLLTDGQVANESQIIRLARQHAETTRLFTFGIGAGVSEYLLRELARVSRGAAEFIYPGERIEPKVLRMFGRVRTPALADVQVDWGGLRVEQAPAEIPPIFAGDRLTIFGRMEAGTADHVTLTAGDRQWRVDLDLATAEQGGPLPLLWARQRIRDIENNGAARRGSAQRQRQRQRDEKRLVEL
ncbi:MAG: VIT domain-containing protein, partial [Acidobacteriota bacterium]